MSQKRKQISLELKLEVLKRFKSGEKAVEIGRNLGLAPSTVRTICKRDADQIKEFARTATPLQAKQITKTRSSAMVKMESLLSIWIENQNQRRMPLSKMVIQKKAVSIFNDIQKNSPSSSCENLEKFEASQGWFERFKTRTNLHNVALREVAELARKANFYGMEENDIDELLISHDEEFHNEDLIGMNVEHALEDDADTPDVVPAEKKLTTGHIAEAMQLISKAMEIFSDNDPDENRSSKVKRSVADAINCYKEIYLEKKAVAIQQTLDNFLVKSARQPNELTEITIDLESSSSE